MSGPSIQPDSFLVHAAWQSTLWLVLGLVVARLLARSPARAHAALCVALVGAVATPIASALSRAAGWGLLAAGPARAGSGALPGGLDAATGAAASLLTLESGLVALWIVGSVLALVRLARGFAASLGIVRAARPSTDRVVAALASHAARCLGLRVTPAIATSPDVASPVVWCWSRAPQILLPAGSRARAGGEEVTDLAPVFVHELAHFLRRDHWTSLVGELACCLAPWNPLAWIARARLRVESERACDQWVLHAGTEPVAYAEALLGLVPGHTGAARATAMPGFQGAAGGRSTLALRLRHILERPRSAPRPGRVFQTLAVAATLATTGGVALAHRGAPEIPDPPLAARAATLPTELRALRDAAGPGVHVLPRELDLGVAPPGATASGSLWIANTGDAPAVVEAAKPTCGCVALVDLAGRLLAPGEVVELPLSMTAPDEPGATKSKHVLVVFRGGTSARVEIRLATPPER